VTETRGDVQGLGHTMNPASTAGVGISRYPGSLPVNEKGSMRDHSISRNTSSTDVVLNVLINVSATLILGVILVLLELHVRRLT